MVPVAWGSDVGHGRPGGAQLQGQVLNKGNHFSGLARTGISGGLDCSRLSF